MRSSWALYRRLAQDRREFSRDCCECAPWGENSRDALRGVWMHCDGLGLRLNLEAAPVR